MAQNGSTYPYHPSVTLRTYNACGPISNLIILGLREFNHQLSYFMIHIHHFHNCGPIIRDSDLTVLVNHYLQDRIYKQGFFLGGIEGDIPSPLEKFVPSFENDKCYMLYMCQNEHWCTKYVCPLLFYYHHFAPLAKYSERNPDE